MIASALRPYWVTLGFGLDVVGCGMLILAVQELFSAGARRWALFLSPPLLLFMCSISYGFHLWQQPFLTTWNTTIFGRFPLSLLVIFACALMSFHWIETPGLRAKQLSSRSTL